MSPAATPVCFLNTDLLCASVSPPRTRAEMSPLLAKHREICWWRLLPKNWPLRIVTHLWSLQHTQSFQKKTKGNGCSSQLIETGEEKAVLGARLVGQAQQADGKCEQTWWAWGPLPISVSCSFSPPNTQLQKKGVTGEGMVLRQLGWSCSRTHTSATFGKTHEQHWLKLNLGK